MNEVKTTEHDRTETTPIVELSAEERQVLARIEERAKGHRPGALTRFLKNPPLFFWWWYGW